MSGTNSGIAWAEGGSGDRGRPSSSDLDRAIVLLKAGSHSCVLCHGEDTLTSDARGIAPLIDWLVAGVTLDGYSAADRVVGRAAALLYAKLDVARVYALVGTQSAQEILITHGIECVMEQVVPRMLNRDHTAGCPMEAAVEGIDDPTIAATRLIESVSAMRARMAEPNGTSKLSCLASRVWEAPSTRRFGRRRPCGRRT
ncbi:MAG: DUF1893 domain-containing protein [Propionibacteriaceae bacterium]|jgi:hypothetical protein|nr:DUF1893 domain-containing protein [Propionibacteriaceae bacterium]